jgi:hypothetical protein
VKRPGYWDDENGDAASWAEGLIDHAVEFSRKRLNDGQASSWQTFSWGSSIVENPTLQK